MIYVITRSRLICLFALTSLTLAAFAVAAPSNLHFERLSADQGFSVGSVDAIIQDTEGFMWFGGPDGLIQYDGYNAISYRSRMNNENSLSGNAVSDIYQDHEGILWVATFTGLNALNRDFGTFTRYKNDKTKANSICDDVIRNIAEDKNGDLWIATYAGLAQFHRKTKTFSCFRHIPSDEHSLKTSDVTRVLVSRSGTLWVGTTLGQLYSLNVDTRKLRLSDYNIGSVHSAITSMWEDKEGNLWIGTDGNGLATFNVKTEIIKHYSQENQSGLSSNVVRDITEDKDGNLWLATEGGLDLLDIRTGEFAHYRHNASDKSSLSSNTLRTLYVDNNQDLWVGNFPVGVNYLDTSNLVFRTFHRDVMSPNSIQQESVLAIKEDSRGNLWFGTDGGGLSRFDRHTEQFTNFLHDPHNPTSVSASGILGIEEDTDGTLWLGTWQGGLNHFDPSTGKVMKVYRSDPAKQDSLGSDNVWAVMLDSKKRLWASTIGGGLNLFDRSTETFSRYLEQFPSRLHATVFWGAYEDHLGQIWAASDGLARYIPEQDHFQFFKTDPNDATSLSSNAVLDMVEDKKNNLWVATRGGGLNMLESPDGKFTRVTEVDGLSSEIITSIERDDQGYLWLGSPAGVVRFNPETKQIIHYTEKNGLQGDHFNIGSSIKTRAGEIVVGGTNGFTIFDPSQLKTNEHVPEVSITDFQIFNKTVPIGAPDSPLSKHISRTQTVTLDYRDSVFSFSFVGMSYRNAPENKFAYMLEGFEKKWNYVSSDRRNATYTNLNPGDYVFRVKASNNHGVWNEVGKSIAIKIPPPPWRTWWAYTTYILTTLGLIKWFVYSQRKQVILLEAKVRERTAELEAVSLTDPLTGLNNRRYLHKLLPMDAARVQREHSRDYVGNPKPPALDLTFILLDIDYFKQVNDVYGHPAGDQLLVQLSSLLKQTCRESDYLIRWGGEEFLIVGRFLSRNEAGEMAERIRHAVENFRFDLGKNVLLKKTCSIGYATFPFTVSEPSLVSWEQVIDVTDHALYIAKHLGRNQTIGIAAPIKTKYENFTERLAVNIDQMIADGELILTKSEE